MRKALGIVATHDITIKNKRILLNLARVRVDNGDFHTITARCDINTYLNGIEIVEMHTTTGYLDLEKKIGLSISDGLWRNSYKLQGIDIDGRFIYTDYDSLAKWFKSSNITSIEIQVASVDELKWHLCETPASVCKMFNINYKPSCIGTLIGCGFEAISIDIEEF